MDLKSLAKDTKASQSKFELWQLLEIVSRLDPKAIIEIGVHRGGFLETMARAFPQASLIGVDNDYSQLNFTKFIAIGGDSHQPSVVEAVSSALGQRQADLLFIDGDHTIDSVTQDFENYSPMVRPGGIVAFHDINNNHIDGVEVMKFFGPKKPTSMTMEIWAGDGHPGIGVLFV